MENATGRRSHQPCLDLRDLTRHFTEGDRIVRAVDGIDVRIESGEIVALLGPNGAGKTTTLDLILGFTEPTGGVVEVFGRPPRESVVAGRMSAVLQTGGLLRDLTVGETVELVASTYDRPTAPDRVIDRAGLGSITDRLVAQCSGGEQQRLRFALALLGDPDVLLLDEPTAGMDVQARRELWDAMTAEAARGRTVVFATHYLQEAEDYAQRTILLNQGRIVADGPTSEIRNRVGTRLVRARVADLEHSAAVLDELDSVSGLRIDGDRLVIETADSDTVARILLNQLDGHDLEIESASLEQAFVSLTSLPRTSRPDENNNHNSVNAQEARS